MWSLSQYMLFVVKITIILQFSLCKKLFNVCKFSRVTESLADLLAMHKLFFKIKTNIKEL